MAAAVSGAAGALGDCGYLGDRAVRDEPERAWYVGGDDELAVVRVVASDEGKERDVDDE